MIIHLVSRSGKPLALRTPVRSWRRDLNSAARLGWYIEGVGFERPFDEFKLAFRIRQVKIISLITGLNSAQRAAVQGDLASYQEPSIRDIEELFRLHKGDNDSLVFLDQGVEVAPESYGGTI
jgi:hypothetical protein